MKKCLLLLFLFSVSLAKNNQEFRATWVITWDHISSAPADVNQARVRYIMDRHAGANMNAVLWQARQSGTAYYRSSYEPWGSYAGGVDPGYDHLAYAIEEAHKRGLEIHAWFNAFSTSSLAEGAPAQKHPEWVCRNSDGFPMITSRCLSPGLAAVRAYTIQVAMELVRKYDIDGLHLDFVRWNEYSGAEAALEKAIEPQAELDGIISDARLAELQTNASSRYLYDVEHPYNAGIPAGFSSWEEWWRDSVTEFVKTLHDSIQAVKPWVRLSAAALGRYNWGAWQGYGDVYQDAALWFNEGYVDQLTPMHYHWSDYWGFHDMLVGRSGDNTAYDCWGKYIQPGIAAGRLYTCGPSATNLDDTNLKWWNPAPMVQAGREVDWVDGFQFFSYGDWESFDYWDTATKTIFPQKQKIRAAKFLHDAVPAAPSMTLQKIDSLQYRIDVMPGAGMSENGWFAIYRSTDSTPNVDSDQIVDIHFGHTPYSFTDRFDGNQNYNGQYHYFVSGFDRFWNESQPSNVESSETIPSLAPRVVAVQPVPGDTVAINAIVQISFSKSMNTATVPAALSLAPAVSVKNYKWSDGDRILVLELSQKLVYATSYTLTITDAAQDVNGRPLDGDGDGLPGGVYHMAFRTLDRDVSAPQVVSIYPDGNLFKVEDIINITFDEFIAGNVLADSLIQLKKNGVAIATGNRILRTGDRSVLSIQPKQVLDINSDYTLWISPSVSDTSGNKIGAPIEVAFSTAPTRNSESKSIDAFNGVDAWKQPTYSGSTIGVVATGCKFELSRAFYLPALTPRQSAALSYQWDPTAASFLLREYLDPAMTPATVMFDTTWTLQCYLFGDGSGNQFRFCLNDSTRDQAAFHEVSQWITIDWYGWRLVEWKLNDPASVGSWIGDGVLNGKSLNIDSIHLTHVEGAALSGVICIDNLAVVKKTNFPVKVEETEPALPAQFTLHQNYPNPFNPFTTISFDLPQDGPVRLALYDVLGREVLLLSEGFRTAGRHRVELDGRTLSSGVYFYRLNFGAQQAVRRLMLVK